MQAMLRAARRAGLLSLRIILQSRGAGLEVEMELRVVNITEY